MTEECLTPSDLLLRWAKVLDQDKCTGCHACTTACKSENQVPLGVARTYVKSAEVGSWRSTASVTPGGRMTSSLASKSAAGHAVAATTMK